MTVMRIDLKQTGLQLEDVRYPTADFSKKPSTNLIPPNNLCSIEIDTWNNAGVLHVFLKKLEGMDLPGKDHVASYLRYVYRRNFKVKTLYGIITALRLFLGLIKESGKACLEDITKKDVEFFIEREQDRGLKITSVRTRLMHVQTFLCYGIDEGFVSPDVFGRKIRLQLPDHLPRAMDPEDVRQLFSVIDHTRGYAMILVLLRTGMRIGELLSLKMADVHIGERRIEIYEGEKNRLGRVVYLSDDAVAALNAWFGERDPRNEYLIYGRKRRPLCYSAARERFEINLMKAGINHKGYSLHALRHTFASELLNAGMRLECLQVLLGH
jgi:site-specific recombinase XerD